MVSIDRSDDFDISLEPTLLFDQREKISSINPCGIIDHIFLKSAES